MIQTASIDNNKKKVKQMTMINKLVKQYPTADII